MEAHFINHRDINNISTPTSQQLQVLVDFLDKTCLAHEKESVVDLHSASDENAKNR